MASVRSKNTGPEWKIRRLLHALGYRYRLHGRSLPGKPDLVFASRRKVIFVHGCFWHGHGCQWGKLPKSRPEFWTTKIERNRQRDSEVLTKLQLSGWEVFTIWQCELRKDAKVFHKAVLSFLGPPGKR